MDRIRHPSRGDDVRAFDSVELKAMREAYADAQTWPVRPSVQEAQLACRVAVNLCDQLTAANARIAALLAVIEAAAEARTGHGRDAAE